MSSPYDGELEELTHNCHSFLKSTGLVASQLDLKNFLTHYRLKGKDQCFIYTGRGPSTNYMHLGHIMPFRVASMLQKYLDVHVVILLSDTEKYLYRKPQQKQLSLADFQGFAENNLEYIKKMGFNTEKTHYYIASKDISVFYNAIML